MWRIGDLEIGGRVVLGPMSGITCGSYREFMRPFGAAVTVTEMISDAGVVNGLKRTMDYVEFESGGVTGLQLFGNDPEIMATAAAEAVRCNPRADLIDVNMGCPAAKVVRRGSGSALMRDPALCGKIVRRIVNAVDVPVTAKIRLGWSSGNMNFIKVIEELSAAGADAVTVHARTADQHYSGTARYDLMEDLQSDMSVPLIVSGDIYSAEDAVRATGITGATAVMTARGSVGNPFLLTQIDRRLETGEVLPDPTVAQQTGWCLELADRMISEKGEDAAMRRFRSIAPKFVAGFHRCRDYRRRLAVEPVDRASLVELLDEIVSEMGSDTMHTGDDGSDGPDVFREDNNGNTA